MKRWLKKHFIPHAGNNHRPHFLHWKTLKKVVAFLFFLELILFVIPTFNFTRYMSELNLGSVLPAVLSTLTNEERAEKNLPELKENPILARAAQLKAEDMASKGYFAHVSPEGRSPWYWLEAVGYNYRYAGENLAVNFSDSHEVTEAWMKSPTHQANIVGQNYTEIGTGIASGIYKGKESIFVAQLYASPAPVPVTNAAPNNVPNVSEREPAQTTVNIPTASVPQLVLGESAEPSKIPTYLRRLLSSPQDATQTVLYTILGIVMIAVFLNIVIKIEHQHPDLLWNGALVGLLILALNFGNGLFAREMVETSFMDFSSSNIDTV